MIFTKPQPFVWRDVNYLLKMMCDVDFVDKHKPLKQKLLSNRKKSIDKRRRRSRDVSNLAGTLRRRKRSAGNVKMRRPVLHTVQHNPMFLYTCIHDSLQPDGQIINSEEEWQHHLDHNFTVLKDEVTRLLLWWWLLLLLLLSLSLSLSLLLELLVLLLCCC